AGCVGLFLIVHGQREKAFARVGILRAGHGDQHADVVVNGDQYCAGGLTGDAASLEGNGRLTELEFLDYRVHGVFLLCVALGEIGKRRGSRTRCILRKAKSWKPEATSRESTPSCHSELPASNWCSSRLLTTQAQATDQGA